MGSAPPLEVLPLVVSRFSLDGGAMFGIIPRPLWAKQHAPDHLGRISLVCRILALRSPETNRVALVDTGMGTSYAAKDTDRYGLDLQGTPHVIAALERAGLSGENVTDVFLTHLHFDHAGGCVTRGQDQTARVTFPKAVHHVQRKHWEWATDPSLKDRGSFLRDHLELLAKEGVLNLLDGPEVPTFDLEMRVVSGHSPQMQIPIIRGEQHTVVFPSDLIPTLAHAKLPWIMAYDLQPLETIKEKERLLTDAAKGNWILILEHDPDCEAARVIYRNDSFILEPCVCPDAL